MACARRGCRSDSLRHEFSPCAALQRPHQAGVEESAVEAQHLVARRAQRWPHPELLPLPFEAATGHAGVVHGVPGVAVPEIVLHGAQVGAPVGKVVTARVPQHVRVDPLQAGALTGDPHQVLHGRSRRLSRQSNFGRLAGYEDVNDADLLALYPVMLQIVGHPSAQTVAGTDMTIDLDRLTRYRRDGSGPSAPTRPGLSHSRSGVSEHAGPPVPPCQGQTRRDSLS